MLKEKIESLKVSKFEDFREGVNYLVADKQKAIVFGFCRKKLTGISKSGEDYNQYEEDFHVPFCIQCISNHLLVSIAKLVIKPGYVLDDNLEVARIDNLKNALHSTLVLEITSDFSSQIGMSIHNETEIVPEANAYLRNNLTRGIQNLIRSRKISAKYAGANTSDNEYVDIRGKNQIRGGGYIDWEWLDAHLMSSSALVPTNYFFLEGSKETGDSIYLGIESSFGIVEVASKYFAPQVTSRCMQLLLENNKCID